MSKASAVQSDKRFTLPLKGEALSPKKLVEKLSQDENSLVRQSLASNPAKSHRLPLS